LSPCTPANARCATPAECAAGALWGFAESTLFFVVPDVLISLTALGSWRRSLLQAGSAVAGALLGGAVLFAWATSAPDAARATVRQVPFVREAMFAVASAGLDTGAFTALVRGSFSGIPYKVYAVEAPGRVRAAAFLLASIPARALRFLVVASAIALVAALLRRFTSIGSRGLRVVLAAGWSAFYAYYWLTI